MKWLISSGRVVDPASGRDEFVDLLIEDGVIRETAISIEPGNGVKTLDASGLIVIPGLIDMHCHLREPGYEYKETVATVCRAAVVGGYTRICVQPSTLPVNDEPAVTRFLVERGAEARLARVHPVGALSRGLEGGELAVQQGRRHVVTPAAIQADADQCLGALEMHEADARAADT